MKPASPELIAFLNAGRVNRDLKLLMADCFTFSLNSGTTLCYTNIDVSFSYGGQNFRADSILVDGLKYRSAVGLDVDQQQIAISVRPGDMLGGASFMQALRQGIFDGAEVQRDRIFFSDRLGGTPVGAVLLFKGRVGSIDEIGRTTAKMTVNSDLVLLDIDMPRNLWQPTCVHVLYDSGCGLAKAAFGAQGVVGAGSTSSLINWSGAALNHQQGSIAFASGGLSGATASVKSVNPGQSFTVSVPFDAAPSAGDSFMIYFGCDHTPQTCQSRFANLSRFRGFPFVPPPETSI